MANDDLSLEPLQLGELILRWEGMRVIYNAMLLLFGAGVVDILHPEWLHHEPFLFRMLDFILLANLCFFAGPLSELVARLLGLATPWFAASTFLMGLLCSAFLVLASLFAWEFTAALPNQ